MHPHIFNFLLAFVLIILAACQTTDYPVDHEQLSKEERIVIAFSHIVGENTPKGLAARRLAELVKERTNGQVEIQVFPNGYLYRDGEEMKALLRGDIQMIAPAMSKLSNVAPEWEVFDLPFAFEKNEEVRDFLSGHMGEILFRKLEMKGFHPVGIWDNGFKQMTNSIRPLHEPKDFLGLKFRIMPSSVISKQFKELNAMTQANSFNEVYQMLERGEMNAQENTFSNIVSKNLHFLQSYLTISNHGYLGYVILMNQEFWESLPKDIKIILHEAMKEVSEWQYKIAKDLNEEALRELKNCDCIEIYHLTSEEKHSWGKVFKPIYQQFEARFGADYIKNLPKHKVDEVQQQIKGE